MKAQYSFNISQEQIDEMDKFFPSEDRNKSRITRIFLKHEYEFPTTKSDQKKLLQVPENTGLVHYILDEEALNILDSYVRVLKTHSEEASRSMVMRDVLDQMFSKNKPVDIVKQKRGFYVPKGTRDKLDSFIGERDRSSVVDFFVQNEYSGPSSSPKELKKRSPQGLEQIMLNLDERTIDKLDDFAADNDVKRSHIFRDVVDQFIQIQTDENSANEPYKEKVKKTLRELEEEVPREVILEAIETYKGNKN